MSLTPLGERVPAPASVEFPPDFGDVRWRDATEADVESVAALYRAMASVDHPGWSETADEVRDEFTHSYVDLSRDTLIAEIDGQGIVAFGQVLMPPGQDTLVRSILFGGVHPEQRARGIGRRMLAWQEARALEQLGGSTKRLPGWIMAFSDERSPSRLKLLERAGFAVSRHFIQLERDLSAAIPALAPAAGLRIVPFTEELSESTRLAKNASFADHWGSQPMTEEQWTSMVELPTQRNDLSFVAIDDGGAVMGLVMTTVNEDDWESSGYSSGYISLVGVTREWRRRGVAPALLARALGAHAALGLERAVLDVDVESPTGALTLYEGMGFTPTTREISLTKVY